MKWSRRSPALAWLLVVSVVGVMAPDTAIGAAELPAASGAWGSHLVGDYDGDGMQDVASYDAVSGEWFVARSTGSEFSVEVWADFSTRVGWDPQLVGDFNGDGRDDVVSYHQASGTWWVNRSTGSGFVLEKWATFSTRVGWDPQLVGDFNGDGRDDVANYHPSNATWWASTADANAFVTTKWATIPIDTPSVFITTTNVPVVVIGHTPDGQYRVETPCGREATIDPIGGTPIHGVDVVIDPGHGGSVDTGAVQNGIVERDLNLEVANTLHAELRSRGISVILTRTANYGATLAQRARIADSANAKLMVSIHHNSSTATPATSSSPGAEVYVQANGESQRLGRLLYDNVVATLAANYSLSWYHSSDAGVLRVVEPGGDESYGMIKRPDTPTALIELGWISNSAEATVYKTSTYPATAADALGQAIEVYLNGGVSSTDIGSRTFTAGRAPGTSQCTDPALD